MLKYSKTLLVTTTLFTLSACTLFNRYDGPIIDETYIHRYGMPVPQEHWTSSGEDGQVVSTLKNGVIVSKTYASGVLEGDTTYTFPHDKTIEKIETYEHGNHVRDIIHYRSGAPYQQVLYLPEGRMVTTWYETGSPQCQEQYIGNFLSQGQYFNPSHQLESSVNDGQGERIVRDHYGQVISHDEFRNGMLYQRKIYHPLGTPKEIIPYQNGVVEGIRTTFLPAGEPNTVEEWRGGVQHGITIVYQNGEKYAEIPYQNGIKHGIERHYRNGTEVVEELTWVNNQMHGPAYTYIGNTTKTDWYYQGRPVTKSNFIFLTTPPVK